jgi:hypothetical protein
MLLDRFRKIIEEMNSLAPDALEAEKRELSKEMLKTVNEENIVNDILHELFKEFVTILCESF